VVALDLRTELLRLVPDEARVTTSESALEGHGQDLTYNARRDPDVVVYARSTEEVSKVLAFANEHRVPVTAFGAGTGLEGGVIPLEGGISLDLSGMDAILELNPEDMQAVVQAGVRRSQLDAAAGRHGLWFPVDPGADATLGGMASTGASGTTTVRYGAMRQQVLALEVVLASGEVIRTGSRAVKSSAGYNLTGLFVGAEGTLGVITELTLRLYGIPDYVVAVRAAFPSPEAACDAAASMAAAGIMLTRCELVDGASIVSMNMFAGTDYPTTPHLWLEFSGGSETSVAGDLETAREIAEAEGCEAFQSETDPTARAKLWEVRHNSLLAAMARAPGLRAYATDVCVPVSQLPEAFRVGRRLLEEHGLVGGVVGHVGDGNYHIGFLIDPDDAEMIERAKQLNAAIVEDALARGGTCTGEHGIGIGKRPFLEREHGDTLPLMRAIKQLVDPNGILNPGKVV
jgi:D-lactate dehydrogenase (cytochrome)